MAELSEFPSASAKDTIAFCWDQVEGHKRQLVTSWVVMVLAVVVADVVCPLIFASILERVAALPGHSRAGEWAVFGPLLVAYGVAGLVAMACWRIAGWLEWGACVRSFAAGLNNGYAHLLQLSYRWHMDHPAGEVISSLGNFSWAFAELVDVASWGLLPVAVVVLSAIGVLAVVAWPAALALLVMVAGFVYVILRRLRLVRAASQAFEDHHSRATGVVADTVTNLMAVRTAAAESHERRRVAAMMRLSVDADLRARSIFMRTQLELESSIVVGTLLALAAGTTMAVHHWASTAALYLILYYSAQVALSLQQSFEHLRQLARSLGRAAKFTAIAGAPVEVTDRPGAGRLNVLRGAVDFDHVGFGYRPGAPLFSDLTLSIRPGEHVALVGASGSGKSTLSKLLLRLMDVDEGGILIDGQDIRDVTLASLRRHISYVPQDPQLLHRTIAENICYGLDPEGADRLRPGAPGGQGGPRRGVRLRPPRRVRHRRRRAGAQALRRPAPAGGHRPGHGQGLAHPGPGRGDLGPGLGVRAPGAGGPVGAHGGLDGTGHRPSALHHLPHGPHRGLRPGGRRAGGHPPSAPRPGRGGWVREALAAPVRRVPGRVTPGTGAGSPATTRLRSHPPGSVAPVRGDAGGTEGPGSGPRMTRRALLAGAAATGMAAAGLGAAVGTGSYAAAARGLGPGGALLPPGSRPYPHLPAGTDTLPQIEHIVVLMMENHSFDDHLGTLGRGDGLTRGADGRPVNYNPDPAGGYVRSFHNPNTCGEADSGIGQDWNKSHTSWADGTNSGFVAACGGASMGYWTGDDLPFYHSMARKFPIGDRYFSSVMAQTYPNRRFLIAGTALGDISTDASGISAVDAPNGTIFDRLNHYGISWKDYYAELPTCALFRAGVPRQPRQGGPPPAVLRRCGRGEPPGLQHRRSLHQLLRGERGHHGGRGLRRPVRRCRHAAGPPGTGPP